MVSSDEGRMVADVARRIFDDIPLTVYDQVAAGEWPMASWVQVEDAGLPLALVPEASGGFGLPLVDGLELVRLAGAAALPLPLAETMIANWVLATAGLPVEPGPLSFSNAPLVAASQTVIGLAPDVPWARHSAFLALARSGATTMIFRHPAANGSSLACNFAEEPRDSVSVEVQFDSIAHSDTPITSETLTLIGAAMRVLQLGGAIESIFAMTVRYVQEREQFGRSLGSFQAVQHLVAQMAGEAAASRVAADLAADALGNGIDPDAIAAAKIRAGEAAGAVAAAAHQLHGAMGFTREHRLHHFTRRVLAWRDEFGGEAMWSTALGRRLAPAGGQVWHKLTEV